MKFLGILFVFFGYMFVYASVAKGGKFATEPWAGLFADAYATDALTNQQVAAAAQPFVPGATPLGPPVLPSAAPVRPRTSPFAAPGFSSLSPNFP